MIFIYSCVTSKGTKALFLLMASAVMVFRRRGVENIAELVAWEKAAHFNRPPGNGHRDGDHRYLSSCFKEVFAVEDFRIQAHELITLGFQATFFGTSGSFYNQY
jgi:hypothetical protein